MRLFDPKTGSTLGTKSVPGRVTALAYDPLGRWLAVASGETGKPGEVRLFQFGPGRPSDSAPLLTLTAHTDAIYALAFSPDGKTTGHRRVRPRHSPVEHARWSIGRTVGLKKPRLTLKDHSDTVYALSFNHDGTLLASGSRGPLP